MKIHFEYEEKDITAGHYFIKNTSPVGSDNVGFARTVTVKVGFAMHKDLANGEQKYCLIDAFVDGMVRSFMTKTEIAEWLTKEGYRPLSRSEAITMFKDMGDHYFRESKLN